MPFLNKLSGFFKKKDKALIKEPDHEIKERETDDLVVSDNNQEDNLNNKDSP